MHDVLEKLFESELSTGLSTPFMRFMFTKFVTKVPGFEEESQRFLASQVESPSNNEHLPLILGYELSGIVED